MKDTGIIKYEPLMKVVTYSGKEYFFPKSYNEQFQETIANNKFVEIQGSMVNVASIDTVDPAGQDTDFVENMIKQLAVDIQKKVRHEIKMRKSKVSTPLTPGILNNIIAKFNNPQ